MTHKDKLKEKYNDIIQDTEGNYIYTGETLKASPDPGKTRLLLAGWLLTLAALIIGSGCIDAAGADSAFYVIMPYIGEVAALFALTWNAVKIVAGGEKIRKYVLNTAKERIPGACRILTIFASLGLVLSALFLLRNGMEGQTAKSILYLVLKLLTAITAEYYNKLFRSIDWIIS